MTKPVKLTREQLGVQKGDTIIIEGDVIFARTDKLVEGEALVAENKRRANLNMMAADKAFRAITIQNPRIHTGAGTPLATFHGQNVYKDKNGVDTMSIESKSLYAPKFGHIQNGQLVEIADPQKNPAPGQKVLLFIEAFGSKAITNAKMGSSFNAIVFPEGDIKFYEGGSGGGGGLAGFGEALNLPVQNLGAQAPAQANVLGQAPVTAPSFAEQPVAAGFGEAPVTAPVAPVAPAPAPVEDNGFAGFGQSPSTVATTGRSNNPFA